IQELVLRLVGAHLEDHIPSPLTFEGEYYTLHAMHAPWSFGKKVAFMWGDDHLETCEDKWTFVFEAKRRAQKSEHGTQLC
ncbi:uncharacterized protein TRAVEDRAFT_131346, partial [Trametes versicolor FP-101664 SS1]|uniref:uncharacterized protein n=1 Tax=Trametes versicolor (strain FP-101664) TaxID=717944 RepID=UPI0004621D7F